MGVSGGRLKVALLLAVLPVGLAQTDQYCVAGTTTTTCTYPSGTDTTFTVPAGVTALLTLDLTGGKGGDFDGQNGVGVDGSGANGASISLRNVVVTPGDVLALCVCGAGVTSDARQLCGCQRARQQPGDID